MTADRRRLLGLCLLIAAAAAVYLVGNGSVALWDRDEPRYAQTSRQMLESGDWVVPHFLDMVRTAKPALIYWCQAAAMAAFGSQGTAGTFAARFPSAVAITVLLVVLSVVFWRRLGSQRTLWTVFVFATSGLTVMSAKMCVTDAVLLAWTTTAQLCLFAAWRGRGTWPVVVAWGAAVGLAGLTKGPVTIGVQLATVAALAVLSRIDRRWRPADVAAEPGVAEPTVRVGLAKVLVAIATVAVIFAPWAVLVSQRTKALPPAVGAAGRTNGTLAPGGSFLWTAFKHEVLDRMVTPLEQHSGPPGYYFLTVWATFFPWSLLLPMAIGVAVRRRADPPTRFALAAVVGPWLMFESFPTKLPHYFLPAFPPLAYLTADALVRCLRGEMNDLRSMPFRVAVCLWAVLVALAGSATWLAVGHYAPLPVGGMVALSVVGAAFAATVAGLVLTRRLTAAAVSLGVGSLLVFAVAYTLYLPRADFLRVSPRVAAVLRSHGVVDPGQCLMLDYMEPSLAFYQGGTIREAGKVGFTRGCLPQFTPWLVVTRDVWDRATPDVRAAFDVVDDVYGLAYADKGRWVHVMVIHRRG